MGIVPSCALDLNAFNCIWFDSDCWIFFCSAAVMLRKYMKNWVSHCVYQPMEASGRMDISTSVAPILHLLCYGRDPSTLVVLKGGQKRLWHLYNEYISPLGWVELLSPFWSGKQPGLCLELEYILVFCSQYTVLHLPANAGTYFFLTSWLNRSPFMKRKELGPFSNTNM